MRGRGRKGRGRAHAAKPRPWRDLHVDLFTHAGCARMTKKLRREPLNFGAKMSWRAHSGPLRARRALASVQGDLMPQSQSPWRDLLVDVFTHFGCARATKTGDASP